MRRSPSGCAKRGSDPDALDAKGESELLIALGPHVEDFVATLFGIEADVHALEAQHHDLRRCSRSSASSCSARR